MAGRDDGPVLFDRQVAPYQCEGSSLVRLLRTLQQVSHRGSHDRRFVPEHSVHERLVEPRKQTCDLDGSGPHGGSRRARKTIPNRHHKLRRQAALLVHPVDQMTNLTSTPLVEHAVHDRHQIFRVNVLDVGPPQDGESQVLLAFPGITVEKHPHGVPGNFRVFETMAVENNRAGFGTEKKAPNGEMRARRRLNARLEGM